MSDTAGLMLAYYKDLFNEDLANEDIYEIIKRSAQDIQDPGFDETSGYGLLDAKKSSGYAHATVCASTQVYERYGSRFYGYNDVPGRFSRPDSYCL